LRPGKETAQIKAAAVGSRFDRVGWVTMYAGEPCTSQIMFDFHGAGSTVWLGAPRHDCNQPNRHSADCDRAGSERTNRLCPNGQCANSHRVEFSSGFLNII